MTSQQRLTLQFAALVLIWSTSFLWIKLVVVEVPPVWLAVWRLVLGATALSVAALLTGHRWPKAYQWRVIAVAAVLGNALPYSLIHAGELTVDSGIAAVLMGTMPLATFVFASIFLGERLVAMQLASLALGFVGLLFLVGTDVLAGLGGAWGQLLVAAGACCYALSATFVRKLVHYFSEQRGAHALASDCLRTAICTTRKPSPSTAAKRIRLGFDVGSRCILHRWRGRFVLPVIGPSARQ